MTFFEFLGIDWAKLPAPLSDGFMGDRNATFRQQFFDFKKTETKTMIQPDGVTDDFRGKTMTLVAGCLNFHAAQSAKSQLN